MNIAHHSWLTCDDTTVTRAFRVALGDIVTNLAMFQDGISG